MTLVDKSSALRWLGIYFDSRLSFANHAEKMATKGRVAATGLHMLTKTTRGVEAEVMRRAVHSCIIPILTYAAPAWWPGKTRVNKTGHTIQNGVERHCKKLNLAQNVALRAILPVWRGYNLAVRSWNTAHSPHTRLFMPACISPPSSVRAKTSVASPI